MKLEIQHVGTINSVDEMENDRLLIAIDAASKTGTVFLTFSKEHGADLEIALGPETAERLLSLLEQAVAFIRKPHV